MDDLAAIGRRVSVLLLIGLLERSASPRPFWPALAGHRRRRPRPPGSRRRLKKAQANAHDAEEERHAYRHFLEEVSEYAELHAKQLAKLEARGESAASQKALAQAIAAKRDKAKPGDIFQPEVQSLFRRLLAEQLEGPDALDARKAVLDGNPTEEEEATVAVVVKVNAVYAAAHPGPRCRRACWRRFQPCPSVSTTGSSAVTSSWSTPWHSSSWTSCRPPRPT
jgi:hypothetical protein